MDSKVTSEKTIGRLSLYRRLLNNLLAEGETHVFSHQLARMARGTAAQVRRDMMAVGYSGSPTRGYDIQELVKSIGHFLDAPRGMNVGLVGVGNLGRAILAYFSGRRPKLAIVAAFDTDPAKYHRKFHGCPCYPTSELTRIVREMDIRIGIVTVPAEEAQRVAEELIDAGARGILNFAPVRIIAHGQPAYVEDIDVTTALEKVAYFARQPHPGAEPEALADAPETAPPPDPDRTPS
jgi:redox-sensing transcriptional repressor